MDIPRHDLVRKRRVRRVIYTLVALLSVAAISYGLSRLEPAAPTVERATVFLDTVKRGPMVRQVRGLGTLIPEEIMYIPARDEGRVERRFVFPGTQVEPHTILLELSNPRLEQEVFEAKSQLKAAEAEYANLKVQLETQRLDREAAAAQIQAEFLQAKAQFNADEQQAKLGLIPELNLTKSRVDVEQLTVRLRLERERLGIRQEAVEAQLAAQRAQIEQLGALYGLRKSQLEQLRVRAGIHGVLQQLEVEVGELVNAGDVLARVSDPKRLKAEIKIPETQAKDVQFGQRAKIDTRNGVIPGSVMRIDPAVLDGTVTVDVKLEAELPKGARPDLSVDGTIELEHLENVLYVGRPVYAQPESRIGLFRLGPDGEHAMRVQVTVGKMSVNTIEIREGLQVGDQVILSDMSAWDAYDRMRTALTN